MCGKEIEGYSPKMITCGCPNMAAITGDKITANDLSQIIMLNSLHKPLVSNFSHEDLAWHEKRKQRKIRKLDFEVR